MSVEYAGYISIVKLAVFLILFFLWLPLVTWVHKDAEAIGTKAVFWTALILATGAVAILIWLIFPVFIVGFLFYLIALAAVAISYIKHRNSHVHEFDRILTIEHIKGLISRGEQKKLDSQKSFIFVSANNNEIPSPEPNTPEFMGYRTACDLFTDALHRRAENILFSPTPQDYSVAYQIDGMASKQPTIDKDRVQYFIHFIKSLADLDTNEKRKPQKGFFKLRIDKNDIEWQLRTAGSTIGEQIQLKLKSGTGPKKLPDFNLSEEQFLQLSKIRDANQGIFIVSGPKKSGVTTTFYALLRNHDAFLNSIDTLEKQPSIDLPNITQNIFTLSDTGTTTYAKKLQSMIRMGPDIVGVADCEDSETANIACQAVKNNKIIYITLQTDNVTQALVKWIELVGDKNLAIENLIGISNQRVLRKLCDQCKQAYSPNREILRKFNLPAQKDKVFYRPGKVIYKKHGKSTTCQDCQGTGFAGRIAIFEIITLNENLKNSIKQISSLSDIAKLLRGAKMLYLQEQALRKVADGLTAINEMVRVFSPPVKTKKQRKNSS